eukprot:362952-Chlamydomonas_euryale.AAC.9
MPATGAVPRGLASPRAARCATPQADRWGTKTDREIRAGAGCVRKKGLAPKKPVWKALTRKNGHHRRCLCLCRLRLRRFRSVRPRCQQGWRLWRNSAGWTRRLAHPLPRRRLPGTGVRVSPQHTTALEIGP